MTRKSIHLALVLPVAVLWASAASAAPISFDISGGSATAYGFAAGTTVSITPSPGLDSAPFTLDLAGPPGSASRTVNFLDISVSGPGVALGLIEASLNFTDPLVGSANGLLVGFSVILDYIAGGTVSVLNNPGPIAFGDGGLFGVTFQGFNSTCYGCSALSGTVTATVSLLRAPKGVPEPTTLTLLGAGLAAFGFAKRKRRQA